MSQIRIEVPEESTICDRNGIHKQRTVNVHNTKEDKIILMDISSNNKWICFVSQYENSAKDLTTTLSVHRFTAFNEKTSKVECLNMAPKCSGADTDGSVIQMGNNIQVQNSICIDEYIQDYKDVGKYLSISSNGQYITLSTYDNKSIKEQSGRCFIFMVRQSKVSLLHQFKCNGRAVIINRKNKLCLAILNTRRLNIYANIFKSHEDFLCDVYNLSLFALSDKEYKRRYFLTPYTYFYGAGKEQDDHSKIINISSTFIKQNILITSLKNGNNTTQFWSLKDDGTRLASIFASGDKVMAISNDLKYVATLDKHGRDGYTLNVYCLRNGCLAHTLRSKTESLAFSHVFFCIGSYNIVATTVTSGATLTESLVNFEVWRIEEETIVYSASKSMGHAALNLFLMPPLQMIVLPFVYEETTSDNRKILKGVYPSLDPKGIFTMKSFELNVNGTQNRFNKTGCREYIRFGLQQEPVAIQWNVSNDYKKLNQNSCLNESSDDEHQLEAAARQTIEEHAQDNRTDNTLCDETLSTDENILKTESIDFTYDDYLDKYYQENHFDENFDLSNNLNDSEGVKCGRLKLGGNNYLIRCGLHTIQLWQLNDNANENISDLQEHRLVYINAYANTEYRSFYLSPNVWRLETFRSVRIVDNSTKLRVILNTMEDQQFYVGNIKDISVNCTQEFFMPVLDDSELFDYHQFESACRALYFISVCIINKDSNILDGYTTEEYESFKKFSPYPMDLIRRQHVKNKNLVFEKTKRLIEEEIEKIDSNCTSFRTIAGSKTLAMLASFNNGRDVLKLLLKNNAIIFNLSTYTVDAKYSIGKIESENTRYGSGRMEKTKPEDLKRPTYPVIYGKSPQTKHMRNNSMSESVLTILIRERQYQLFELMFIRILFDSKKANPECLMILNDALALLQEFHHIDLYKKCCLKLSYLPAGDETLFSTEIPDDIPLKADLGIKDDLINDIKNVYYFSILEQIPKLSSKKNSFDIIGMGTFPERLLLFAPKLWKKFRTLLPNVTGSSKDSSPLTENTLVRCMIPYPYFNNYYRTNVWDTFLSDPSTGKCIWKSVKSSYKSKSEFLLSVSNQHQEPNVWKQGGDIIAIVLQYKWKTFIQKRFYGICIVYLIYYASYVTGIQFARETYGYDSNNAERSIVANRQHVTTIFFFFLSGAILLYFEVRQVPKSRKFMQYFRNWYNLVDLMAISLPLINFFQLIRNWGNFYEVASICALILCFHGIVRLRVFPSVGIALETIIQLFRQVLSILVILLVVVLSFTYSFIVLLRQQTDQYFQEKYSGETSVSNNEGSLSVGNTTLYDLSSSNGFSEPLKAFFQVWLFIFGVWDPVTTGEAGDDRMIFVLCILFAFITVLIFTNMLIALMSSTVEEVRKRGKKVWITHFADVVAEIEDLTFPTTRHNRANNPAVLFYLANSERVALHAEGLERDMQRLRKSLEIDR